jgi:hypothetical protein
MRWRFATVNVLEVAHLVVLNPRFVKHCTLPLSSSLHVAFSPPHIACAARENFSIANCSR